MFLLVPFQTGSEYVSINRIKDEHYETLGYSTVTEKSVRL